MTFIEWLGIVGPVMGLVGWFYHLTDRKIEKMDAEFKAFREMWIQESKDFHGRLCAIEERRKS